MRPRPKVLEAALVAAALIACDSGRDRLLADLQSVRPEERALAVKKLGEMAKPDDLVLFTRAAKDQAGIVRSEAVVALGKSQDVRVVDLLGELLGDPDDGVQARAAMALAEIKNDKAKAYLTMQYARRGRSTRQAIVQALKAAGVPNAMPSAVAAEAKTLWDRNVKALTEGTPPERVAAAEELGKSGRPEAVTRLLALVKDSQVILAAAAVRGLGFAGDKTAVKPIAELLSENFPELREAACESLLRLDDAQALPRLHDVALERSAASPLATAAIIASPRSPEADRFLCDIALSAAPTEASQAGREMRKRGGCPLEPILERLTHGRESQPAALQAIGALGPTAKDTLLKVLPLLTSSDNPVRRGAFSAVSEIGDPSATEAVEKAYQLELKALEPLRARWIQGELPQQYEPGFDPSTASLTDKPSDSSLDRAKQGELFKRVHEINDAHLKAAGKTPIQARPPREIVDDVTDEQLRPLAAAIRALGTLRAPDALNALKKHLDDSSMVVRRAAYEGLAALGPEGIAVAQAGLLESERELQSAVAQALADQGEPGQKAILDMLPRLSGEKLPLLAALEHSGPVPAAASALQVLVKGGGADAALAARLLGTLRAEDSVEVLIKALDDPETVARRDVLIALGRIGSPKAAASVARDLYNDSPDVRAAAAEALATVGNGAQAEPLDALTGDYYRRVRESTQDALGHLAANPEPRK